MTDLTLHGKKNDGLDNKTRWELMPLDCLEDIARVYTEGAKKYGDNNWKTLDNGYERYKGALLRHLYDAETSVFDRETGCRHLAQVAWNAIAMLYLSKDFDPVYSDDDQFFNDIFKQLGNLNEKDTYGSKI